MVKTLFVDTNVFLSLYAFSDEDIEQFRNLFILSQEGEIDFLLTQQVIDEFWRNREAKISESIVSIRQKSNLKMPAPVRELPEATLLLKSHRDFEDKRQALVDAFLKKAAGHKLKADELIVDIFKKSTVIEVTEDILERARKRVVLGNPPGKSGSYGDAINWECILEKIEILDDLYFVSRDKDYSSSLHDGRFNEFLSRELSDSRAALIFYFGSLRAFMDEKFPKIEIEAFNAALDAVQSLESSGSFLNTHIAISKLAACDNFSTNLVKRMIVAAEENSQISSIIQDVDVQQFYASLLEEFGTMLGSSWTKRLKSVIFASEGDEETNLDEVPF